MDIEGSSAVVTGGASGLGAATARALTEGGAAVTIIDLDADGGTALAAALPRASYARGDVTDPDTVRSIIEGAASAAPLRVAVNCAGIAIGARTVDRDGAPADLDAFERVIRINLVGTYNVARCAAAAMAKNDPLEHGERGVIINTASIAAYEGQVGQTAYAASKGGVVALTLPMARDLASLGIRVNTVAPGIIDTKLLAGLDDEMRAALAAGVPVPQATRYP